MNGRVIDLHCDTITELYRKKKDGNDPEINLYENELQLDLKGMKESGYLLQNFAVFLNKRKYENLYQTANQIIDFYEQELAAYSQIIRPVRSFQEILENDSRGIMSALLTLEGGEILEGSVDNLQNFYDRGVRMLTLTWNYKNEIGYPNFDKDEFVKSGKTEPDFTAVETVHGLTEKGIEILEKMEELGIIPDVSHGSDALFYEVLSHTKKPFVASHSNAREVHHIFRNLSDDMIRGLAERGGVMGINYCADFVSANSSKDQICYERDLTAHMKYIKKVGGIEILALGSDFDGIDNRVEWENAGGMCHLFDTMKKEGFSENEIDLITRDNALRIYREWL